jgi:hypothetical protein
MKKFNEMSNHQVLTIMDCIEEELVEFQPPIIKRRECKLFRITRLIEGHGFTAEEASKALDLWEIDKLNQETVDSFDPSYNPNDEYLPCDESAFCGCWQCKQEEAHDEFVLAMHDTITPSPVELSLNVSPNNKGEEKMEVAIKVEYGVQGTGSRQIATAEISGRQPAEIKGTPLGRGATREEALRDLRQRILAESKVTITTNVSPQPAKETKVKSLKEQIGECWINLKAETYGWEWGFAEDKLDELFGKYIEACLAKKRKEEGTLSNFREQDIRIMAGDNFSFQKALWENDQY